MVGGKSGSLQNNINFVDLGILDITGAYAGNGPTWTMEGSIDLGTASLAIEKTAVFAIGRHTLHVGSLNIGTGSNSTGELHIQGGFTIETEPVFPPFGAYIGKNHQLAIEFKSPLISKGRVQIYDIQGRLIDDVLIGARVKKVIVRKILTSKIYLVQIQSGAEIFSKVVCRIE